LSGAVIEYHGSPVVILVKSFSLVFKGKAFFQGKIMFQGFVITAPHLEAISVGIRSGIGTIFQVTVLECPAVLQRSAHIVCSSEVSVPAIVTILPCPAAVEIITTTHGQFGCKTVGISIVSRISIIIRITVPDGVIRRPVVKLQSAVPVPVKRTVFNDVIASSFYFHSIVTGPGNINSFDMPVASGQFNAPVISVQRLS